MTLTARTIPVHGDEIDERVNCDEHDEKLLEVKKELQDDVWNKLFTPVGPIDLD